MISVWTIIWLWADICGWFLPSGGERRRFGAVAVHIFFDNGEVSQPHDSFMGNVLMILRGLIMGYCILRQAKSLNLQAIFCRYFFHGLFWFAILMGCFMAILMLTQILWTRDGMGYRHFETKPYDSKIMIWICLEIGCPQIHWFIIIVPIDEHGFWGNAAFSPNLALKCWCQEGDLYDPAGTITGGSAPKGGNTLMKLQELFGAESMKYGSTGDTESGTWLLDAISLNILNVETDDYMLL